MTSRSDRHTEKSRLNSVFEFSPSCHPQFANSDPPLDGAGLQICLPMGILKAPRRLSTLVSQLLGGSNGLIPAENNTTASAVPLKRLISFFEWPPTKNANGRPFSALLCQPMWATASIYHHHRPYLVAQARLGPANLHAGSPDTRLMLHVSTPELRGNHQA